jgi:hypothetical protein
MVSPSKWIGLLLLVFPVAAIADPVQILTHGSGLMRPDDGMLQTLGMHSVPEEVPQPYVLTINAALDPDADGVVWQPDVPSFEQPGTQVEVAFDYGMQHFRYAGPGDVILQSGNVPQSGDYYYLRVSFVLPDAYYHTRITADAFAPSPGVDTYPLLAPPAIGGPNGLPVTKGESAISAEFNYYDDYWYGYIGARAQDMSVTVTSAVPEPAATPLLAAGLLTMGLLSMGRRRGGAGTRPSAARARP